MIKRSAWALALVLSFVAGCGEASPRPGVKIYSFDVGVFDADQRFTPSTAVPFKSGSLYGYLLTVSSTSGSVRVREIFDLPAAGVWSEVAGSPPGVSKIEWRVANDGKQLVQEFDIECGEKAARYGQIYEVAVGDPLGTYKFTIYLDGELTEEAEITLREE